MTSFQIFGYMGKFSEMSSTPKGTQVFNFQIVVKSQKKDRDGKAMYEYYSCESYGKTAENLKNWVKQGQQVFVSGAIRQDIWQDKNTGQKRSKNIHTVYSFEKSFIPEKSTGQVSIGNQDYMQKEENIPF